MSYIDTSPPPLFTKELMFSYALLLTISIISILEYFLLPPQIPLWYSLSRPEQHLVPKIWIMIFPLGGSAIALLHTLIINKLRFMDATIIKIFSFGTTLILFLFLVSLVHIVYLFL